MTDHGTNAPPPTWIVGVDGSENARHAALWATAHADGRAREIRLLAAWHVTGGAYHPGAAVLPMRDVNEVQRATEEYVNTLAEQLGSTTGVPITTAVANGGASRVLLDAAPPDGLVVVGTRGHGGFARLVIGSTSTQVATHSSAPTAVVPLESAVDRAQRIVVAIDGSANSIAALEWAIEFARANPSPATALACVMVSDGLPTITRDASDVDDPRSAFEHLVATRSKSAPPMVDVTTRFVEGAPRTVLAEAAESADLLVMGTRGHGAVGAALLGSVSTWLLHRAHVPMVIVPAERSADGPTRSGDRSS